MERTTVSLGQGAHREVIYVAYAIAVLLVIGAIALAAMRRRRESEVGWEASQQGPAP